MTGPEFAKAHGNDSSDWISSDFEAEIVFAEIDAQPAWIAIKTKTKPATPQIAPAA